MKGNHCQLFTRRTQPICGPSLQAAHACWQLHAQIDTIHQDNLSMQVASHHTWQGHTTDWHSLHISSSTLMKIGTLSTKHHWGVSACLKFRNSTHHCRARL